MPVKSLRATNFGPFVGDEITFEPDVTVLTGANDTGNVDAQAPQIDLHEDGQQLSHRTRYKL